MEAKEELEQQKFEEKINEQNNSHFVYFIITHEKEMPLNAILSSEYKLANTLEIIDKKNLFMKSCILVATIYRFKIINIPPYNNSNEFKIIIENENKNSNDFFLKINDFNKDFYEFNVKLENISIIPLNYEQQFGIYLDILRNKYGKKRGSKEYDELILSTHLLFEDDRYQYNFLFYFSVFLECLSSQYAYKHLLLFNSDKIKEIGEISEEKLLEIKNEINLLIKNPEKIFIINKNYIQILLELFFTLVYYFNLNFQKEQLKLMFENKQICQYLYKNCANSKFIFKNYYIEIEYMNILIEKAQNYNDILNLLTYLGDDFLNFLKFINCNKNIILDNFIKQENKKKKTKSSNYFD